MGNGKDKGVITSGWESVGDSDAVFVLNEVRVCPWVVDSYVVGVLV